MGGGAVESGCKGQRKGAVSSVRLRPLCKASGRDRHGHLNDPGGALVKTLVHHCRHFEGVVGVHLGLGPSSVGLWVGKSGIINNNN